jgi:hypothetical protein
LLCQQPFPQPRSSRPAHGDVSIGQYFGAIRFFLEQTGNSLMASVAADLNGQSRTPEAIDRIDVYLVKHGAFYQPAKLRVVIDGKAYPFALNVALSEAGRGCIEQEYRLLKKLNGRFGNGYLPAVYAYGEAPLASGIKARLILGQWLQGYREFHMHPSKGDRRGEVDVWDDKPGGRFLKPAEAAAVYRQAAFILTFYCDLETFEQIYPWHHAAGDFVVKLTEGAPEVRLITVRQYAPMIDCLPEDRRELLWDALLYFLLNLSIRMRLDRVEGTGDTIWSEPYVVDEVVKGFSRAMAQKLPLDGLPFHPLDGFKAYVNEHSESDWLSRAQEVVSGYHPGAPEVSVVKANLKNHVAVLFHSLQALMA